MLQVTVCSLLQMTHLTKPVKRQQHVHMGISQAMIHFSKESRRGKWGLGTGKSGVWLQAKESNSLKVHFGDMSNILKKKKEYALTKLLKYTCLFSQQ